jgi:NAD(P)-dependent dehydrogenase (short-subunit alcohol dehydrogenase family)
MQRILITGSNRGIGLGLAQEYARRPDTLVFATCRNPDAAYDLHTLAAQHPGRVQIIALDAGDPDSIAESVSVMSAHTDALDVLMNNAAINPRLDATRTFGKLEADAILDVLRVNSVGPVLVAQAYADLLRRGNSARVVNISSGSGSLAYQASGCGYTYNASKAALNMFTRCLAGTFRSSGVIVITLNPGWVKTDMGGSGAHLSIAESSRGVIAVTDGLTLDDSGEFFQWDGQRLPW